MSEGVIDYSCRGCVHNKVADIYPKVTCGKGKPIEACRCDEYTTVAALQAENARLRKLLANYCWTDEDIERELGGEG